MAQVIQANNLELYQVQARFNLQQVWNDQFFWEWQGNLPEITDEEKHWLDKVKADFLSLAPYPSHEEIVKLFVLAPILSLANLTSYPFIPIAEKQVEFDYEEDETKIRGKIDLLILHQQLWMIVIESKPKQSDALTALAQALFYMMNNPNTEKPTFGLLTNGNRFIFVKLVQQDKPTYALSEDFSLYGRGNELHGVLAILKGLRDRILDANNHKDF